jgi:hypothetical protein
MPKTKRITPKKKTPRSRPAPSAAKNKPEVGQAAAFAPAAVQKFVSDALVRGEAGTLKNGKLEQGRLFVKNKKGSATELTRARFSLTG